MSVEAAKHARELLLKEYRGVLSTHSKSMPGFPFGSVVPYCLDALGRPLILISRIAQHTHNLQKDPKCSLFVGERGAEDVQAVGRLTYLAEAQQIEDEAAIEAAAERYYRYFPDSQSYHKAHDFDFWREGAGAHPDAVGHGAAYRQHDLAGRGGCGGQALKSGICHAVSGKPGFARLFSCSRSGHRMQG